MNSVKDASLVIGAMQTAAYAIGIGSCCILGYPAKELKTKKTKENDVGYPEMEKRK